MHELSLSSSARVTKQSSTFFRRADSLTWWAYEREQLVFDVHDLFRAHGSCLFYLILPLQHARVYQQLRNFWKTPISLTTLFTRTYRFSAALGFWEHRIGPIYDVEGTHIHQADEKLRHSHWFLFKKMFQLTAILLKILTGISSARSKVVFTLRSVCTQISVIDVFNRNPHEERRRWWSLFLRTEWSGNHVIAEHCRRRKSNRIRRITVICSEPHFLHYPFCASF